MKRRARNIADVRGQWRQVVQLVAADQRDDGVGDPALSDQSGQHRGRALRVGVEPEDGDVELRTSRSRPRACGAKVEDIEIARNRHPTGAHKVDHPGRIDGRRVGKDQRTTKLRWVVGAHVEHADRWRDVNGFTTSRGSGRGQMD